MLPSLGAGGAERVASTLANHWCERGCSVFIFLLNPPSSSFYSLDERINVKTSSLERSPSETLCARFISKLHFFVTIFRLRVFIKKNQPTTVLSFLPSSNVLSIIAALGLRTRTVVCERNAIMHKKVSNALAICRWLTYRFADLVTVNLSTNISSLERFVPKANILFLPNPVSLPQSIANPSHRHRTILSVGRLHEQKAFDTLIRAYAKSRSHRNGWKLKIVGEGPAKEQLAKLAREHGLDPAQTLMPATRNLWETHSRSSVFVLASRYEGLPNALLEALAHGLVPIVSKGVGDLAFDLEALYPNFVFDIDDEKKLVDNLDWLTLEKIDKGAEFPLLKGVLEPYNTQRVMKLWTQAVWPANVSRARVL